MESVTPAEEPVKGPLIDIDRIKAMTAPVKYFFSILPKDAVFTKIVVKEPPPNLDFTVPEYILKSGRRRSS